MPFCPIRGRSPGLSRCFFLYRFRSPVRYRIPGPASGRSFVRVCRGSRCRCIPLRHRPVPDREKRIFAARLVEDRTQPCGVAVGDQDLPERIFGHEADQLLHAPGVELVEEVVQQQDRFFPFGLGDLFDKLDAGRVEQLIRLVGDDGFGQIFITDCNPTRLRTILDKTGDDYSLFTVENGGIVR